MTPDGDVGTKSAQTRDRLRDSVTPGSFAPPEGGRPGVALSRDVSLLVSAPASYRTWPSESSAAARRCTVDMDARCHSTHTVGVRDAGAATPARRRRAPAVRNAAVDGDRSPRPRGGRDASERQQPDELPLPPRAGAARPRRRCARPSRAAESRPGRRVSPPDRPGIGDDVLAAPRAQSDARRPGPRVSRTAIIDPAIVIEKTTCGEEAPESRGPCADAADGVWDRGHHWAADDDRRACSRRRLVSPPLPRNRDRGHHRPGCGGAVQLCAPWRDESCGSSARSSSSRSAASQPARSSARDADRVRRQELRRRRRDRDPVAAPVRRERVAQRRDNRAPPRQGAHPRAPRARAARDER